MSDATATLRIKTVMDSGDVISNINQIQSTLKSLKMPKDLTSKTEAKFEELTSLVKEYQNLLDKPHKSNADLRRLDQLSSQIKKVESEAEKMIRSFDFSKIDTSEIDSAALRKLNTELDETKKKMANITKANFDIKPGKGMDSVLSKIKKAQEAAQGTGSRKTKNLFEKLTEGINTGNLDQVTKSVRELDRYLKPGAFGNVESVITPFKGVRAEVEAIISEMKKADSEFTQTAHAAEMIENSIKGEVANRMTEMAHSAAQVGDGFREASTAANAYVDSMNHAANQQSEMQQQVSMLQQQVKNYFGLDEIFRKIGELARSAMDTVKELDAAMTETAVVTNFDVSDMWKMLPTYTKNANQLGSTIADVYNAATLYYQQGLTTSQSMGLANETLKMARIGGIEAAEATDMMTAALRGFNMEINQTSAQRVNDVYSKLAAITAADTKEIGTAMERTASIASSANMDFETTSAFLAQMIETTREAPENLGTAMKTIVARFQEMKVDPNSLVDSEGERLDFNRVDKALKSIGISLVDEHNQFRDLDDVFIEISSRWDGLTQAQQRYIATIAAGSRQQSRFIAMMQDYDRTMELVDAAYTAEGAGQAQFEKTLESMDSKLNRLKNAWDQFAMGFMNADFLKVGVDAGTKFLDIFEKVITAISNVASFGIDPFGGLIKSALTATAVFGGLLAMSRLLMAGIGKFAGLALGEKVAKEHKGIVGATYRAHHDPEKERDRENRKQKVLQQKERATQARQYKNETFRQGVSQAAQRRGTQRAEAKSEPVRKVKQAGLNAKNYFSNLKEGAKYQKALKKEAASFQQNIEKETQKGFSKSSGFKTAFMAAGKDMQTALAPSVANAFRKSVQGSNLDAAGKQAALNFINGAEAELNSGKIDAKGMFQKLEGELGQKGINADFSNEAKKMSSLASISTQFQKIGSGATKAGSAIQMFGANLMGTPLAPFGTALMVAGQGLENIGMILGSGLTKIREWASGMVAAGAATLAAGTEASVAGNFFRGLGLAIKESLLPILPFIAAAAAVAGVIAGIYLSATKNSKALKLQGDVAAQASQDLDTTKQALEAVNNDLEELSNNDNALNSLIVGTTEWNNQLAEANAHIIEMMGLYKTLNEIGENDQYKYIKTDEDGRMSITKEGQKAIQKEYENAVSLATANNAIQGALYNNLKDKNSKEYKDAAKITGEDTDTSSPGRNRWGAVNTTTDEYKQAKLLTDNVKQANEAREENAWKTGIHAAIDDLNIPQQETVENILTSQRDTLQANNKLGTTLGKREELETEYADLMGYKRTGKGEYVDAQGNDLTIDWKVVKEELPELRTLSDMQDRAGDVSKALTHMESKFMGFDKKDIFDNQLITDIMADSVDANADEINKLTEGFDSGKSELNKFIEGLKLDETDTLNNAQARELEKLIGAEEGSIKTVTDYNKALDTYGENIYEHSEAIKKQQQESVKGAAGVLSQLEDFNLRDVKGGEFSYDEMSKISIIGEGLGDNFGTDAVQNFAAQMRDASLEARTEIQDILSGVDFSSGLQTISAFDKMTNSLNEDVKAYGEEWKNTTTYTEAASRAIQEVIVADDFTEALKDIDGEATAAQMQAVANESASLKQYLDSTGMSVGAFAKVWNDLQGSSLNLQDLTPGVIAFANAMDQVAGATGRALDSIENFDAGDDLGSVDEFVANAKSALKEMKENGEFGNTQMGSYFDHFFGAGKWEERSQSLGSYSKAYDELEGTLNKYMTDDGWNTDYFEKIIGDAKDTETALQNILDNTELTETAADEALTAVINKSDTLGLKLQKGDIAKGFNEFITYGQKLAETYGKTSELGSIISGSDLITNGILAGNTDEYKNLVAGQYGEDFANELQTTWIPALQNGSKSMEDFSKWLQNPTIGEGEEQKTIETPEGIIRTNETSSNAEIAAEVGRVFYEQNGKHTGVAFDSFDGNMEELSQAFVQAAGGDITKGYEALEAQISKNDAWLNQQYEFQGQTATGQEILDAGGVEAWISGITENQQWVTVGETIGQSIVAALENWNLTEKLQKDSNYNNDNQYTKKGELNEEGLESAYNTITDKTSDKEVIAQSVGSYLKQGAGQFKEMDANQQAQAIDSLVGKMNEWNFSPEQIASAINTAYDTHYTKDDVTGEKGGYQLNIDKENLQGQLTGLEAEVTANITNIVMNAEASGQNNYRLGTFARGSRGGYTLPGRPTLTGEEGEELVWEPKRNEAYMVGSNGPQFANISRDAVVWNADQTRRIKKNSSVTGFGTGARGIKHFGTMGGGQHGGGPAGGKGGASISGTLTIPATAEVQDVKPYTGKPVPIKGKLEIDGANNGSLKDKIKSKLGLGGEKQGIKVDVTANATDINVDKGVKPVDITGTLKTIKPMQKAYNVKGVTASATVTSVKRGASISGEPVSIKAKATVDSTDGSQAIESLSSAASGSQSMSVGADTSAAVGKVNALIAKIKSAHPKIKVGVSPNSIRVPVRASFLGPWEKKVKITKDDARGQNYQKYNSYASGHGLAGPKGKGGLTLTGEEGYEVVWLPKQNKSMIVGMEGPQMMNLPSDAVVWPHNQSKKILKNNQGKPVGSSAKGTIDAGSLKSGSKTPPEFYYGVYQARKTEPKFFALIDTIEKAKDKIDLWSKSIDTAKDKIDDFAKNISKSNTLINQQIKTQSNLLKSSLKQAKTERDTAKAAIKAIDQSNKRIAISYNTHAGKKAKSKEFRIAEGGLVKRNGDRLEVNESWIRDYAVKKGKNAYQVNQIMEEMRSQGKSLVDEYNGLLNDAEEHIKDIQKQQQELQETVMEMFYTYERELTKIKKLEGEIKFHDSFNSIVTAASSLLESQIKAGFKTGKEAVGNFLNYFNQELTSITKKITNQNGLITERINALTNDKKITDDYNDWRAAENAAAKAGRSDVKLNAKAAAAYEKYQSEKLAKQYMSITKGANGEFMINLDVNKLEKAVQAGNLREDQYKAIYEYYERVSEDIDALNSSVTDLYSSVSELYDKISSTYSEMDDYAKKVISGMQENEQQTIDSLTTLNESLRDAFSDLISSIKKELDKQRKAEQNQETEKNINDQMNRLAMLRADTSGSNAAEIAKLEKDIQKATGDYEDSLEDQLLDRLQEDADKAAEQREQQITVLKEQLEYTKAIGQYVTKAENLILKYTNGTATAEDMAELRNFYMLGTNGKDPLTIWGKKVAEGEWEVASEHMLTFNQRIQTLNDTITKILKQLGNIDISNYTNKVTGDTTAATKSMKKTMADTDIKRLKREGGSAQSIFNAVRNSGKSVLDSVKTMRSSGYGAGTVAGLTYKNSNGKTTKVGAKTMLNAGYTYKQIAPYYSAKELQSVAKSTGTTNKTNKSIGGGKSKLSGTTKSVKNTAGKSVQATFTESGVEAFNQGQNVVYRNPQTGKYSTIPLTKFTKSDYLNPKNAEYKEFIQAIQYAIQNNKLKSSGSSSKLGKGKQVKGLKPAIKKAIATGAWDKSGANKAYSISGTGVMGSAGSSGDIYFNYYGKKKNEAGIKKWNPDNGKITKAYKIDKKTYKKHRGDIKSHTKAKYIGREYKDAANAWNKKNKKKQLKYKQGGIADFTGPAWMDGTKSKPELVLNATDTKNFLALKDVLSEANKHGIFNHGESNNSGDMTFDININVDKIENDYDVDKIAARVKKNIIQEAKYRNVTVTGHAR